MCARTPVNFVELFTCEVRRMLILRGWMNASAHTPRYNVTTLNEEEVMTFSAMFREPVPAQRGA
jgi:hypothetical protein